jgi:small-conductance mechanosensitive channel
VHVTEVWDSLGPLAETLLAAVAGVAVVEIGHRLMRRVGRRVWLLERMTRYTFRPAQLLVATIAAWFALHATTTAGPWRGPLLHALLIAAIGAGGWLLGALLLGLEDAAKSRFRIDVPDNRAARRVQTQVTILRRVTVALVIVLTVGVVLTTFDGIRAFGATLLASAGIAGVIAGLAAQSTLGNLFAGLQLAFGGALRIDDVVVVEGEWGRVEELTLCNVVIRIWDDRRLVLPTSYFTIRPFTVWTRRGAEILGTVELDMDWAVPVPQLRAELDRFVTGHPDWDGRELRLHVTDATASLVRVRALVSAADASRMWELRCAVREHLVEWIRTHHPQALPRTRADLTAAVTTTGDGSAGWSPPPPRLGEP